MWKTVRVGRVLIEAPRTNVLYACLDPNIYNRCNFVNWRISYLASMKRVEDRTLHSILNISWADSRATILYEVDTQKSPSHNLSGSSPCGKFRLKPLRFRRGQVLNSDPEYHTSTTSTSATSTNPADATIKKAFSSDWIFCDFGLVLLALLLPNAHSAVLFQLETPGRQ